MLLSFYASIMLSLWSDDPNILIFDVLAFFEDTGVDMVYEAGVEVE